MIEPGPVQECARFCLFCLLLIGLGMVYCFKLDSLSKWDICVIGVRMGRLYKDKVI